MTHEKIDPGLLVALADFQRAGRTGLVRHTRTLGLFPAESSPKQPRTVVFLRCKETDPLAYPATSGIRVNQSSGRVRTAIVTMDSLDQLSDDPAVERIIPARYLRPRLDVAAGAVHLAALQGSGGGLDGSGVIVGIVDSGIDPSHPAFAGRILRIWDQALPGPGVLEGAFGAELTGPLMTVSRDTNGHGTHVAGIAAGDDAKFRGVAPGANLVIVKTDFQDAHIADGIRYIFRVAGEMGRPAVVNLSLGGHGDAHDGTDPLSEIIDSESGPGRIVCCAAGNEGNDNIHARATVPAGGIKTIRFRVPPNTVGNALLNGWYPGNRQFGVSLRSPGGFVTAFQAVIPAGPPERVYTLPDAQIVVVTPGPDPANGDHNFFVSIQGPTQGSAVKGGIWQLRVRGGPGGGGQLDVWALDDQEAPEVTFAGTSVQDAVKIGSPGTADAAVTVGAYTTRDQWTDIDGIGRQVGLTLNTIADFSSEGPLRKGAQKPDVTGPGAMIVSALSADSTPERASMINSSFLVMAGTSMATPFLAGIVALLLQRQGNLDPAGVKALLRGKSAVPGQPAGTFDTKWGFGLIDAQGL